MSSELRTRILGGVGLLILCLLMTIPNPVLRALYISLFLALGAWEYARMWNNIEIQPTPKLVPIALAVWVGVLALRYSPYSPLSMHATMGFALAGVFALVLHAFYRLPVQRVFPWISFHLFGGAFFVLWAGQCLKLMRWESGLASMYPFFATVFCMIFADTGAYFSGRAFGKHKLAPAISPKKTIEGLLGGTAACICFTILAFPLLPSLNLWNRMVLGLMLSLVAPMGDLFFSALKRWAGIKDSSQLIPGHGGVLDRFDSLFFAAPFALFYIQP